MRKQETLASTHLQFLKGLNLSLAGKRSWEKIPGVVWHPVLLHLLAEQTPEDRLWSNKALCP